MRTIFQILIMLFLATGYPAYNATNRPAGAEDFIYFVCRASVQKSSLIATTFNLRDSLISHVGIGLLEEKGLRIYHVEDKKGNALSVNTLQQFISPGIFYYSVYAIPVSREEVSKVNAVLNSFNTVQFDHNLCLENGSLYCSEFCLMILHSVDPKKFAFNPVTKEISHPFVRSYLGREKIIYIPVDFFLSYPGIIKIREQVLSLR